MTLSTSLGSVARQGWREQAACSTSPDKTLWDAEVAGETPGERETRHRAAKAICQRCPSLNDCYAEGRTRKEEGVWGKRLMPKKKSGPPYISTGIVRRRAS